MEKLPKKYKELTLLNLVSLAILLFFVFIVHGHFDPEVYYVKMVVALGKSLTLDYFQWNDLFLLFEAFSWINTLFPSIPWYTLFVVIPTWLSIILALNTVWFLAYNKALSLWLRIGLPLLLLILFLPNIFWIHHNRTAFLLSASAIVVIQMIPSFDLSKIKSWSLYFLAFSVFIFGFLMRIEAGIVSTIICVSSLTILNYKAFSSWFKRILPILAVVVCSLIYYNYQVQHNDSFYYQIEPDLEYEIVNRRNIIDIDKMTSSVDSARYLAVAHNWMLGDIKANPPSYIKSLIKNNSSSLRNNVKDIKWYLFTDLLRHRGHYLLMPILLLGLGVYKKSKKQLLITSFTLLSVLGFLALSFSVDAFARVYEPLLFIMNFLVVIGYCWLMEPNQNKHLVVSLVVPLFGIITMLVQFNNYYQIHQSLLQTETSVSQTIEEQIINDNSRQYIVVLGDFALFNLPPFEAYQAFPDKQLFLPDFGQFTGCVGIQSTQQEASGCDEGDFSCFFSFLKAHKEEVILVASARKIAFIDYYLNTVYDLELNFSSSESYQLENESYIWKP